MLEHFSPKAIEAISIAREEARRLEYSQISGAHIVLGLIGEGMGVAARALEGVGLDLRKLRTAAERLWGRGYERSAEILTSAEAGKIFQEAMKIAEQTEPLLIDTQDLLRAILAVPACTGVALLQEAGVQPELLLRRLMEERAEELIGSAPVSPKPSDPPKHYHSRLLSPLARQALEAATERTVAFGHSLVGTEQLLMGLLELDQGAASRILRQNGLVALEVEALAHRVIGRGSGTMGPTIYSRWVEEALEHSWKFARKYQRNSIGTLDLLLGLLELDSGGALHLMDLLKANLASIQFDAQTAFIHQPRELEPVPSA